MISKIKGLSSRSTRTYNRVIRVPVAKMIWSFCEISTIDLSYVVPVKSTVKILQNSVDFSEYMNFKTAKSVSRSTAAANAADAKLS